MKKVSRILPLSALSSKAYIKLGLLIYMLSGFCIIEFPIPDCVNTFIIPARDNKWRCFNNTSRLVPVFWLSSVILGLKGTAVDISRSSFFIFIPVS